ncbi:Bax inhibitor-1/YccA family protein [Gordonia shandongensis]|uniref:Bax inhibitor-1/YccA family protein n=1 Tax=Gordonia shandongensis TaxID=376351 RepID=UPI00042885F7|nr:Bax inhibitor-1/YccA family protein [Gordonia shandongensis]
MRESNNPIMRGVIRDNKKDANGYATFGTGLAGAGQASMTHGQQQHLEQYTQGYQAPAGIRPMTIDDVVTKTAMTLGVLIAVAVASYGIIATSGGGDILAQQKMALPFLAVGAIGGLVLVLIASFGRKQDNPAIVLAYAAFEGLFVGAISFVFGNMSVSDTSPGALIGQAVLGTIGVFVGMLIVYKVGAVRVTPRFTRMMTAGLVGVLVLMVGNLVLGMFGVETGLREAGPIGYIFSLVCIGLAAFSFLIDFDAADQLIRAGAPSKAAWGVALGLTVTLVWLYVEILRLLSYLNSD